MNATDPRGYVIGWGEHDACDVSIEAYRVYASKADAERQTNRDKGEDVYALIPASAVEGEAAALREVAALRELGVELHTLALIGLGLLGTAERSSAVAPLIRQAMIRLGLTESDVTGGPVA